MPNIADMAAGFAGLAWGPWLLVLLLGGGAWFFVSSRLLPFRYLPHAVQLLTGRFDQACAPGQLSHFRALASALAGTVGMGNIAGVAVALTAGGPGAIFWMWMTALLGVATKFFTCTLAVHFRGPDSAGEIQGGPMYVIREGMPARARPLAGFFCAVALVGCLPLFQTNQLVQIVRDVWVEGELGVTLGDNRLGFDLGLGVLLAAVTGIVIYGGIQRIASTAARVVPIMTVFYVGASLAVIMLNIAEVPAALGQIVALAFEPAAAAGGLIGVILIGVQRGAFSNEAGIGTEALAHGAAKTSHAVREGLVAMTGPIIDTLLVCTCTALVIMLSGVLGAGAQNGADGVTLTASAFGGVLGHTGTLVLFICVVAFSLTTILTYSYYGTKCFAYLFGVSRAPIYAGIYVASLPVAAVLSLDTAINVIDGCFALMAIPTMISALWLSPVVLREARIYFTALRESSGGSAG